MQSDSPNNINDILRAGFSGSPAGEIAAPTLPGVMQSEDPVPPPPEPGSVEAPEIGVGDANGKRVTARQEATPVGDPVPAASPPDARLQKIIAAQQQARQEHLQRKQELTLAEQDRKDLAEYRALRERAKEDPVGVAEHFGYKPDEYAATLIDKGAMTPERRALAEVRKELSDLKAFKQEYAQERAQQEQERNHLLVVGELTRLAQADPENYDLVSRVPGAYNAAIQKVFTHYQQTGEELPLEQALTLTEQELVDRFYTSVADSPKIRSKFGAAAPQGTSSPAPAARQRAQNLRATSAAPAKMSEAQALEQAGKLLFNQFKF